MEKTLLVCMVAALIFVLLSGVAYAGWSTWTYLQKHKFQTCWSQKCNQLLIGKKYDEYQICSLACSSEADKYKEEVASCNDTDGGTNYSAKGIVATDTNPEGKEDYCYTFTSGKTYLMEGVCSNNKYATIQKNCAELGKYKCENGNCVSNCWDNIHYKEEKSQRIGSIRQTTDGGYVAAGKIQLSKDNKGDASTGLVLKINSAGKVEWQYFLGVDSPQNYEAFTSIVQTTDGNYVAAGTNNWKMWILKFNPAGEVLWEKTFEGQPYVYSIEQTGDENIIAVGGGFTPGTFTLNSDIVALKLDKGGNLIWEKTFGGEYEDVGFSIKETGDGNYIVTGTKQKSVPKDCYGCDCDNDGGGSTEGDLDAWILKLDSEGKLLWDKTFGTTKPGECGSDEMFDYARDIKPTKDGGYIVAGYLQSPIYQNYNDVWVFKLDKDGNLVWDKIYGGAYYQEAYSVQQVADDGYIVVGRTQDSGTSDNALVLKFASNGDLLWDKAISESSSADIVYSVIEDSQQNYVLGGFSWVNAWIFRLNQAGALVCK